MTSVRKVFGYAWAALPIPIVLVGFLGLGAWSKLLARSTGIQVSPRFTGGEVVKTLPHPGFETRIHRSVFDGLVGERPRGFVQVDWVAIPPTKVLPGRINEQVDYDDDGAVDFVIALDTKANQVRLKALQPDVLGVQRVMVLNEGRVVRVELKNKRFEKPSGL